MRQSQTRSNTLVLSLLLFLLPQASRAQQLEGVVPLGEFVPFTIAGNDSIDRFYLVGVSQLGDVPLVVLDGNNNSLRFVDIQDQGLVIPDGIAANRNSGDVFVLAGFPPVIKIVDALKDEVTTIPIPDFQFFGFGAPPLPRFVAVNSETGIVYLLDALGGGGGSTGGIGVFDPTTQDFSVVPFADAFPLSIAVNSQTNMIYVPAVSLSGEGLLLAFNGADLSMTTISFGAEIFPFQAIGINDVTNTIYVGGTDGPSRGLAIVNGADNSFRFLPLGDVEPFDIAVNTQTNQIVSVARGAFQGGAFLTIVDGGTDRVEIIDLGVFDVAGVAVNRFSGRVYVPGISEIGEPQILVFGPRVCSSNVTSLAALRSEVEGLTASTETIQQLIGVLNNVERALNENRPKFARLRLALFQDKVVVLSSLSGGAGIPLGEANDVYCSASNVLVGIEVP